MGLNEIMLLSLVRDFLQSTCTELVEIIVQFLPTVSGTVVWLYFGGGRFLLMKVNVAASTACPHSMRISHSVSTVNRAFPTCTTAAGFGFGSNCARHTATMRSRSRQKRRDRDMFARAKTAAFGRG